MTRTTNWHRIFSRRRRALVLASFVSIASYFFGATELLAVVVDDGAVGTPTPLATIVSTMPVPVGTVSGITAATGPTTNLGSFDIVLLKSPSLLANVPASQAFDRAAQMWESFIADPITVTINADFSLLGSGILGSTGSVFLQADYNTIRDQLVIDASDEPDDLIVASMPTAAQFTATLPAGFSLNGNLIATKANLKAIGGFGDLDGSFGVPDADIAFSTAFSWDFDKTNGITGGAFDFEGVAAHEIGHALGFVSIVDDIDFILPGGSTQIQPLVIDLFRFADGGGSDPATAAQFTTFPRNLVPGANDIFDQVLGGGQGDIEVRVSTGVDFGDGRQASHWKDGLGLGIMDPTAAPGELLILRPNDRRAMDLIGYEVVPEAGTLSLVLIGGALTYLGRRRW